MNTSPSVKEISRVEITKTILVDLQKLSSYSGEPIAAVYADNLLRTMRTMRDKCTTDPYTEVVMAREHPNLAETHYSRCYLANNRGIDVGLHNCKNDCSYGA